jgi:hypothetical protein
MGHSKVEAMEQAPAGETYMGMKQDLQKLIVSPVATAKSSNTSYNYMYQESQMLQSQTAS